MSYSHFTLEERVLLYKLLKDGMSIREIAGALGRDPSSVSRERQRNESENGEYIPFKAHQMADTRKQKKRRCRLPDGAEITRYVTEKLKLFWSPEAIAARLFLEQGIVIGVSTIYRYLKAGKLEGVTVRGNLRRRGVPYVNRTESQKIHMTIKPNRIIPEWPEEIRDRSRIGDWECDTIAGNVGTGLITTMVDRHSRLLLAAKATSKRSTEHRQLILRMLEGMEVQSLSFDNGVEFAKHEELEKDLGVLAYFAEPHKPWQRGTNENANGVLRFFFPKGSDFREVTQQKIDEVVAMLNNRPRKCLGWRTPAEVYYSGVALD